MPGFLSDVQKLIAIACELAHRLCEIEFDEQAEHEGKRNETRRRCESLDIAIWHFNCDADEWAELDVSLRDARFTEVSIRWTVGRDRLDDVVLVGGIASLAQQCFSHTGRHGRGAEQYGETQATTKTTTRDSRRIGSRDRNFR